MDGYLTKPLQIEALLAVLEQIGLTEPAPPSAEGAGDSGAAGFDPQRALQHIGGDAALLKELAALFLEECPKHLAAIRAAIAAGDAPQVQQAAHTLKGSAAVITATLVQASAERIEAAARERRWEDIHQNWNELEQAVSLLQPALQAPIA